MDCLIEKEQWSTLKDINTRDNFAMASRMEMAFISMKKDNWNYKGNGKEENSLDDRLYNTSYKINLDKMMLTLLLLASTLYIINSKTSTNIYQTLFFLYIFFYNYFNNLFKYHIVNVEHSIHR